MMRSGNAGQFKQNVGNNFVQKQQFTQKLTPSTVKLPTNGTVGYLGTVKTPEKTANLNWGGDGRTLYITASTSLYRIRLKIPGVRP